MWLGKRVSQPQKFMPVMKRTLQFQQFQSPSYIRWHSQAVYFSTRCIQIYLILVQLHWSNQLALVANLFAFPQVLLDVKASGQLGKLCIKQLQMESIQQFDLVFIRHAESQTNKATKQFVLKHNLVQDWQHLSKNHHYLQEVKYGFALWDASITKEGLEQCKAARKEVSQFQPDVVLVSPLNRTLQTCWQIFGGVSCPIIVQPILGEALRSSCDFSRGIEEKKVKYPTYDFSKVQKLGSFWMIYNDSEENQAEYDKIIRQNQDKSHEEVIIQIFELMKKTLIYETPTNLIRRTTCLKQLLKEYKSKFNKIAVVSHYNIIRFILASEFNQKDEPVHCHIGNCEIKKLQVNDL